MLKKVNETQKIYQDKLDFVGSMIGLCFCNPILAIFMTCLNVYLTISDQNMMTFQREYLPWSDPNTDYTGSI